MTFPWNVPTALYYCDTMKLQRLVLLLVILANAFHVAGQKPSAFSREGDRSFEEGAYLKAYAYYEEAYALDSSSFELIFRFAECARYAKDYALAERLYDKAYQRDEGKLQPDGLYWLAQMQKANGKYEDAQRNFKKYLKKHKSKGNKALVNRAEDEAKSALWALNYKPSSNDSLRTSNWRKVNESEAEIAPVYVNGVVYYSTGNGEGWQLMRMSYPDGEAARIGGNGFTNLKWNAEGTEVFGTMVKDQTLSIGRAKVSDQLLEAPEVIDGLSVDGKMHTQPAPARVNGNQVLFFVSDREGGEGGMDIWYTEEKEGKWSKPRNAGKLINTAGDELTPFYSNGALYFSSDLHPGFGGQDIFVSRGAPGSWATPVNMGAALNSNANDFYFSFDRKARIGFLSSNRTGSTTDGVYSTCCNDIYKVEGWKDENKQDSITVVKKDAPLLAINERLPVRLYFHNDEPDPRTRDTITRLSYMQCYEHYLELIPEYRRENAEGLSGEKQEEAVQRVDDFFDHQVKQGVVELEALMDLMLGELQKGNSLQLNVRGFASPRAESDYNLNLTKRRTSSLVNYLKIARNGAFKEYIDSSAQNGAQLRFQLLPFGEYKAAQGVSDDLKDVKQSIYSRKACLERKIEIESVVRLDNASRNSNLMQRGDTIDFGRTHFTDEPLRYIYVIENLDNEMLIIDSVVAECGCTQAELSNHYIAPGDEAQLKLNFAPFAPKGRPVEKQVLLYSKGLVWRRITLRVVGE